MRIESGTLCKGGRYPYVTVGLHIPDLLAQLIRFLGASAARLIWNGLQLARVDVVQQGSEDLPGSLKTRHTMSGRERKVEE